MLNFQFYAPTLYAFGDGQEKNLGALISRFGGTKVLLVHYGGDFVNWTPAYYDVVDALKEAGIPFAEVTGVQPNPRSGKVYEGIEIGRREGCDFVLAIGGGSSIDCAKAIALGIPYEGDFWDFFAEKAPITTTLPVGVVLTIAASGSEGSGHCVITNENGNLKWGIPPTDIVRPKFAVLNPRYTQSLPPFQIACGAFDMFSHVWERYFTHTKDVRLTDRISEALMRTAIEAGSKAVKDPSDYAAQADLMWVGNLAQNDSSGVGRIPEWTSHLIEHELSALFECAHGAGLAVVMPAWMQYVMPNDVDRFAQAAVEIWGCDMNWGDPKATAQEGIDRTRAWAKSMGLPTTLGEVGATAADIPAIVEHRKAKGFPLGYNVQIFEDDMAEILKLAL